METNNSLFIWRLYPKAWNVLQQFSVASWADVSHSRLLTLLLKWTIKRVFGKMSFVETRVKEGWTSSIRFQRKAERKGDTVASLSARGSGLQQKLLIRVCLLWWALVMIIIITPEMLIIIFRQFFKAILYNIFPHLTTASERMNTPSDEIPGLLLSTKCSHQPCKWVL